MSVLTISSMSRPRSSNLNMFMRSQVIRAPFGSSSPTGEWVNGAVKVPSIQVEGLRLTVLPRARGAGVAVAESHPFAARERIAPGELADQG